MTNNVNIITVFDATIFTLLADHLNEGRQNRAKLSEAVSDIRKISVNW